MGSPENPVSVVRRHPATVERVGPEIAAILHAHRNGGATCSQPGLLAVRAGRPACVVPAAAEIDLSIPSSASSRRSGPGLLVDPALVEVPEDAAERDRLDEEGERAGLDALAEPPAVHEGRPERLADVEDHGLGPADRGSRSSGLDAAAPRSSTRRSRAAARSGVWVVADDPLEALEELLGRRRRREQVRHVLGVGGQALDELALPRGADQPLAALEVVVERADRDPGPPRDVCQPQRRLTALVEDVPATTSSARSIVAAPRERTTCVRRTGMGGTWCGSPTRVSAVLLDPSRHGSDGVPRDR